MRARLFSPLVIFVNDSFPSTVYFILVFRQQLGLTAGGTFHHCTFLIHLQSINDSSYLQCREGLLVFTEPARLYAADSTPSLRTSRRSPVSRCAHQKEARLCCCAAEATVRFVSSRNTLLLRASTKNVSRWLATVRTTVYSSFSKFILLSLPFLF